MTRIPSQRFAEIIGEGLRRIPERITDRLSHVQFVCGVDPGFAGLHRYGDIDDGRSYRDTAHCCYPFNLARPASERVTTIVLPTLANLGPATVVHELGHALHQIVGFDQLAAATTSYARTNRYEAFAEYFTTWLHHGYGDEAALHDDRSSLALLEGLAA